MSIMFNQNIYIYIYVCVCVCVYVCVCVCVCVLNVHRENASPTIKKMISYIGHTTTKLSPATF